MQVVEEGEGVRLLLLLYRIMKLLILLYQMLLLYRIMEILQVVVVVVEVPLQWFMLSLPRETSALPLTRRHRVVHPT